MWCGAFFLSFKFVFFLKVSKADTAGLDLVEISPNVKPPVCKILDFGKYKYEAQKKASVAKKKQKETVLKEIKMRPGTDVHDYNFKVKAAQKFITLGDKVKFTIRFKGDEVVVVVVVVGPIGLGRRRGRRRVLRQPEGSVGRCR